MNPLSIEEQMKACTQNSSGMFEVGEELMCAVIDHLIAIRELKGDQVPVALIDERQGSGGFCLTQHGRRLSLKHGTELFTAPQKPVFPVELREDIFRCVDDSMHGCNSLSAPDYAVRVAGWLAAGGIVKDGE